MPKGVSQQTAGTMIPKGYRVVSIRVDAISGGGNLLLPGDRVDLLVHMGRNESNGIVETTTRTFLQDIRVFAVNDVMNLEAGGDTKSIQARTVSLLVTPEQAEILTMACELGSIKLVMRSPEDSDQKRPKGASAGFVGPGRAVAAREWNARRRLRSGIGQAGSKEIRR